MPGIDQSPLVTPRYDREPDGIPGPFYVTKQCVICALPVETAPANISWDEDWKQRGCTGCVKHCRVTKQPETVKELDLIIEALEASCVGAIRYCGTDRAILARLESRGLIKFCDALIGMRHPPQEG
jgi:hypothetical protein